MISAERFRAIALALDGASEAPHFDRLAFRRARVFATLAADGETANLKLTLDDQEMRRSVRPDAYAPVPGGWGRRGWTRAELSALDETEASAVLRAAWREAAPRPRGGARARGGKP